LQTYIRFKKANRLSFREGESIVTTKETDLPMKLGKPAERALAAAGIQRLAQLTKFSEAEIKKLHGVGPNAINKLRSALMAKGLSFADEKQKKG
jgi:hypothetical protein